MFDCSKPSMTDGLPPVTRLTIFSTEAGPVKVALSLLWMLNCPKLWNKFFPRSSPTVAGIL
jgi:hypothetical protein